MTFEEYWENEGCRKQCATHEDRAREAWRAAAKSFTVGQLAETMLEIMRGDEKEKRKEQDQKIKSLYDGVPPYSHVELMSYEE